MSDQYLLSIGALILLAPHIHKHVAYLLVAVIYIAKGVVFLAGAEA